MRTAAIRTIFVLKEQRGLAIDFGYGNATTDSCAYAGAAIVGRVAEANKR